MRRVAMALATVVLAGLAAGPAAAQFEELAAAGEDGAISRLAVITASEGTYAVDAEGSGRLTLEGVGRATWFSDRPAREVGVYGIEEMLEVFFTDQVPPNAALEVLSGADEARDVVILELSAPLFDADSGSLAYDAIVLEPGADVPDDSPLAAHYDRADASVPASFGTSVLFIDSTLPPEDRPSQSGLRVPNSWFWDS